MNQNIRWEDVQKKEAIGIDRCDLGKVQAIKDDTIITEIGVINKKRYFLPKKLIDKFNGNILYIKIMKAEAKQFRRN